MEKPAKIVRPEARLSHHHTRIDLRRDTRAMVTRNVSGHIHVTLGNSEVTMILHPHAAARLIADLQAVMKGADHAFD